MTYPIAEIFHSVQGEGYWTGTPMMFVRLAGCNVGRYEKDFIVPMPANSGATSLDLRMAHPKHSICTSFDGQRFLCDTDYHCVKQMTIKEILTELKLEAHVCITGGEPFLHNLAPLVQALYNLEDEKAVELVHIETSGTKSIKDLRCWITLCPKENILKESWQKADEVKILVGPNFKMADLLQVEAKYPFSFEHRYLQPINGVDKVWQENLDRCLTLLEAWPHWKLSAQLHKYLGVR